ncbi:MAG: tetratricopeptide repeat protein [Planctomycetota bacterium]|jgi:tetratricopeptide (TPR) repeat protein
MAKTLTQFIGDIRAYLGKAKVKAARKALDKAIKAGHKGPSLDEVTLELLLAEGGGADAAKQFRLLAKSAEARLPAAVKHVDAHLRKVKEDHALRDVMWEACLDLGDYDAALRHSDALHRANAVNGGDRAQALLGRKDVVGAAGIFLLASLGALKTDRIKLANRLLANPQGARTLSGLVNSLYAKGLSDGAIHYVLAQLAQKQGDHAAFLEHAGRAFEENPEEVWTWTVENVGSRERLEIALQNESLKHLVHAAGEADGEEIIEIAKKSAGEGPAAKTLRGLALLMQDKAPNACRILEGLAAEDPASAAPVAELLASKAAEWQGAREVYGAVVASGLGDSVPAAIDGMLQVEEPGEAWGRVAPRLLDSAPDRDDLRAALGLYLLEQGEQDQAAALLTKYEHLEIAKQWAATGKAAAPVLLGAAALAEEHDKIADHADWLLKAGGQDSELLSTLGRKLSGSAVSAETALRSAATLLDQGQKSEAAELLAHLPLDADTGRALDGLLKERKLHDDRGFQTVSFRCALSLGDKNRARRLFKSVSSNVQALAAEAALHGDAGRVLADVLIGEGKGEVAVGLVDARRAAGDEARTLLPLADGLLKASPKLSMGRLVRAKLLSALDRKADAVRDLRAIPANAAEVGEAFDLLGELSGEEGDGDATLGRADIHIGRKEYKRAVEELTGSSAKATARLERFVTICRDQAEFDAGHKGRALCLLELGRIPEAADAHLKRFACPDADPGSVATDLEDVARAALKENDLQTGGAVLEQLPEQVSDGAERAIGVIGDDRRPALLILRSKLLLQLGRTDDAVQTLTDLVDADAPSRPQAAQALEMIVDSGQARPDADFALAGAFDAMGRTGEALNSLSRLYGDDITGKEKVVEAAKKLVVRQDDPEVRLFLGRVCLDMRNPAGATDHAIHARRLNPAARRDCVDLLRRALDLDAFAPETHFALAEAHLAGDEADDAVRHFRAAVEVDRSRSASAIEAMEEAAPRSKHPALLWLAVGTTYAEFGKDHGNAVSAFTKGLEANPTAELRVPLLLGRGDSYAALHEDDDAFDDFDEASKHDLLERRYYEFLRARHRKRELDRAREAETKAGDDFAQAAEAVSRFVRLGQTQEAVEVAQAALAAKPTDLGCRYLVGVALHAAGRYDAAAQVLEAVRASAGAGTEVGRAARMLLAESYLDQGDRPHARTCLTEIESVDAAYPGLEARRAALAPPADDPHAPPPLFVRPLFPRPTE